MGESGGHGGAAAIHTSARGGVERQRADVSTSVARKSMPGTSPETQSPRWDHKPWHERDQLLRMVRVWFGF